MIVFGAIGMGAFLYGKNLSRLGPLFIGLILMIYPYFVSGIFLMWGIGIALCVWLFMIREQ